MEQDSIQALVKQAINEFVSQQQTKAEPAYKAELVEERKRREELERRVNDLVKENQRAKQMAEEADQSATVRTELQKIGVTKIDLAYRAIKDSVIRMPNGELVAREGGQEFALRDYLRQFVTENPELLPARQIGGSGALFQSKAQPSGGALDLERLSPGMSDEELLRARMEIARMASQALKGV